ncbi:hypothetical protein [Nocardia sp. CA-119907]|uniref:hypothetical protein n=1 Tax=Nocardia sp. CA-119907 TaxID=3239973 RepID=UPI003D998721
MDFAHSANGSFIPIAADRGAWTQRYEHGVPVTDLLPITSNGTTGTTVHFRPDRNLPAMDGSEAEELMRLNSQRRHRSVDIANAR